MNGKIIIVFFTIRLKESSYWWIGCKWCYALPGYEFVLLLVLDRKWLLVYLFALSFHPIFLPLSDRPIVSPCRVVMKWNAGACMHGFGVMTCFIVMLACTFLSVPDCLMVCGIIEVVLCRNLEEKSLCTHAIPVVKRSIFGPFSGTTYVETTISPRMHSCVPQPTSSWNTCRVFHMIFVYFLYDTSCDMRKEESGSYWSCESVWFGFVRHCNLKAGLEGLFDGVPDHQSGAV